MLYVQFLFWSQCLLVAIKVFSPVVSLTIKAVIFTDNTFSCLQVMWILLQTRWICWTAIVQATQPEHMDIHSLSCIMYLQILLFGIYLIGWKHLLITEMNLDLCLASHFYETLMLLNVRPCICPSWEYQAQMLSLTLLCIKFFL